MFPRILILKTCREHLQNGSGRACGGTKITNPVILRIKVMTDATLPRSEHITAVKDDTDRRKDRQPR